MEENEFLYGCLEELARKNASDLHMKSGEVPRIRLEKQLRPIGDVKPSLKFLEALVKSHLSEYQKNAFERNRAVDFAFTREPLGRFRANVFSQRGELAIVIRRLTMNVPNFKDLRLPRIMDDLSRIERGLILLAGPVGSGKTTSIAALVDQINKTRHVSVITLEDPVEYLYKDDKAFISQRELGIDIDTFQSGLRFIVRQDPDVVVVGEIRDAETLRAALAAAETGRLVISSCHGKSIQQSFERMLGLYPHDAHEQILNELSFNLKAVICQRLLPSTTHGKLIPVCEVLMMNPSACKIVREGQLGKISQIMQNGVHEGMQTMNHALLQLVQQGDISRDDALMASDNPQALEMNMKGIYMDEGRGGIIGSEKSE